MIHAGNEFRIETEVYKAAAQSDMQIDCRLNWSNGVDRHDDVVFQSERIAIFHHHFAAAFVYMYKLDIFRFLANCTTSWHTFFLFTSVVPSAQMLFFYMFTSI